MIPETFDLFSVWVTRSLIIHCWRFWPVRKRCPLHLLHKILFFELFCKFFLYSCSVCIILRQKRGNRRPKQTKMFKFIALFLRYYSLLWKGRSSFENLKVWTSCFQFSFTLFYIWVIINTYFINKLFLICKKSILK